jgi:hypothetical protein
VSEHAPTLHLKYFGVSVMIGGGDDDDDDDNNGGVVVVVTIPRLFCKSFRQQQVAL